LAGMVLLCPSLYIQRTNPPFFFVSD
jgi:hypothetical protein